MRIKNLRQYKDEFIKLYTEEGYSLRKIGEMYGVNKASVAKYIKEEFEIKTKGLEEDEKEKVEQLYLENYTVNKISTVLNLPYSTVKNYLSKQFGIVTNGAKRFEHLRGVIVTDYENNLSAREISEKYNISKQTVMNYIAESKVKARTYSETSRLYKLNEDYFDNLDEHNSYILGMIFSKGRLDTCYGGYFVEINVLKSRTDILELITGELYTDKHPRFNVVDNTLKIRILSKKIYSILDSYGLYNNANKQDKKGQSVVFADSFWRGFIYAGLTINKRNMNITGYEVDIDALAKYLDSLGILYRRERGTAVTLENKKEIKKLIEDHGFTFIKTFIKNYIKNLGKNEEHAWSLILNNKKRTK